MVSQSVIFNSFYNGCTLQNSFDVTNLPGLLLTSDRCLCTKASAQNNFQNFPNYSFRELTTTLPPVQTGIQLSL